MLEVRIFQIASMVQPFGVMTLEVCKDRIIGDIFEDTAPTHVLHVTMPRLVVFLKERIGATIELQDMYSEALA